uniref:Carbohydrate kinase PfkB domain-containing protein n=2 Tax=Clastoptera arizonana TaxID=38151 RepID=A0A1B6CF50_9HEMI
MPSTQLLTIGTVCSIFVILLSCYYKHPEEELNIRLSTVLQGLIDIENQFLSYTPKIAVGYGACLDLFIDGKDILLYDETIGEPEHCDEISSIVELKKSYAYYFRHGAAAERYISNSTLFDELVSYAGQSKSSHYSLGGNAPTMALRLNEEGCEVLLAATLTTNLKKALPSNIKVVGIESKRDDVHLILEYKAGELWGPYTAPRANRFIIHNDDNNPLVNSLEEFEKGLKTFSTDLLVISGLQMMDKYPFQIGERENRLIRIREQMISQKPTTKIHFEMASFSEIGLLNELKKWIIPHANSLGMNEQELTNLVSIFQFGNVSFITDSNPRIAAVLDQMRQLLRLIDDFTSDIPNRRKLTRIHVHTLAYQAIMTDNSSDWINSDIAAAKASLTAHRHVCASPQVDVDRAMLIMDESFSISVHEPNNRVIFEPTNPVSCWNESSYTICVAPVLVCTNSTQTAGGGDNISAAGLAVQL